MSTKGSGERLVAANRKALHDYEILEKAEAGLVLQGTEVKSLRQGRANLKDGYVVSETGDAFLVGTHTSVYEAGSWWNHEPERKRKLLLHRREIERLAAKVQEKGLTIVPLRLYFKGSRVKVELGVGRGKKLHDKRRTEREREMERETRAAVKENRG